MTPEQSQDDEIWRRAVTIRMEAFEHKLDENTQTTQRVDESTRELIVILNSWKGAMTVFEFIGKIAKPLAAILGVFGAVYAWWQHK